MRIFGIGLSSNSKTSKSSSLNNNKCTENNQSMTNVISHSAVDSKLLQNYYISFGSKSRVGKQDELRANYTQEAEDLIDAAAVVAKQYGHEEINEVHMMKACLESLTEYMNDLDSGEKSYDESSTYMLTHPIESITTPLVFKDADERKKIKPVIEEEIKLLDAELKKMPEVSPKEGARTSTLPLSNKLVNASYNIYTALCQDAGTDFTQVDDSLFMAALFNMNVEKTDSMTNMFVDKLTSAVMLDRREPEEKIHLNSYDDNAKIILKNLALGTNMFITYDKKSNPTYLVDSVVDILENQKLDFGKINPEKTKITLFNDNIKDGYFLKTVKKLSKDKDNNHILIADLDEMLLNSAQIIELPDGTMGKQPRYSGEFLQLMKKPPENLRFIFVESKNCYYSNMADGILQRAFENFQELSFPVLSAEQAKKAFREQPLLMHKVGKHFTPKALDRAIESAAPLDGTYPEKAQKLIKKLASYYVGEKEITEKLVVDYVKEAKDLFKLNGDDSSIEIVFDTGKKINDILGKESTRREAAAIVRQIKNKTLGTKGAIIYTQDGYPGGGRKHTAKAIAGEAKVPYVEINTLDFGTKDVDIFGGGNLSPEASVKKLFSLIRAQADTNPSKSAVLYIENFEYFSVGEYVSEYHQKAMSQLLREMENASKKGLNILVLGSVTDPDLIGESTMKSFKFVDTIEVSSPGGDLKSREEILTHFLKERKLKVAGSNEKEKQAIIKSAAETVKYFPFIYLVNLVDKTRTVALERGHKLLQKEDFTEAYLQLTTGRPALGHISDHRKKIVTSHECGHALNLEIMHNLAEQQNIPWHLPDRVNFITLDPRGDYGGAMYHKQGENEEFSFEKMFADLVCTYGGHSCEKHFYNIDGSWGITSDLEAATHEANMAVQYLGQGARTGKYSIGGIHLEPTAQKKTLMEKDADALMANSLLISDLITETYADFNKEFTEKYWDLVGTGDCLIPGDTFRNELKAWIDKQDEQKKNEIEDLNELMLEVIRYSKKGQKYWSYDNPTILPSTQRANNIEKK